MTDLLQELNDTDTRLTDELTGLIKGDPGFEEIRIARRNLRTQIREFQRLIAADATVQFVHGNTKLVQINKQLKSDLDSLASMQQKIDAIKNLLDAVTEFLGAIAPAIV
jgi:hypothetical protein